VKVMKLRRDQAGVIPYNVDFDAYGYILRRRTASVACENTADVKALDFGFGPVRNFCCS
jgi:hypothetical protein